MKTKGQFMSVFIGNKIITILNDNSFKNEALRLEKSLNDIHSNNDDIKKSAIEEILGFCQIKAFGDLNIKTINGWEWNKMLEKLRKYALNKT